MRKLMILLIALTIGLANAKLEKIDDNYYRLTSENVREIAVLKEEKEYYQEETIKARNESSFNIYYFAGGFILGVLIAK